MRFLVGVVCGVAGLALLAAFAYKTLMFLVYALPR